MAVMVIPVEGWDGNLTVKYLIIPGWTKSKHDGSHKFITSRELVNLYGVSSVECKIFNYEYDKYKDFTGLIPLVPKSDGSYHIKPSPIQGGITC